MGQCLSKMPDIDMCDSQEVADFAGRLMAQRFNVEECFYDRNCTQLWRCTSPDSPGREFVCKSPGPGNDHSEYNKCYTTEADIARRINQRCPGLAPQLVGWDVSSDFAALIYERNLTDLNHVLIAWAAQRNPHHNPRVATMDPEVVKWAQSICDNDALSISTHMIRCIYQLHHVAGVVHLDIKPGNFVLGRDTCVRLIDFATAQLVETCHNPGFEVTTRWYRPPEDFFPENFTHKGRHTDAWGAGLCVLFALYGEHVVRGDTDTETALEIVGFFGVPPADVVRNPLTHNFLTRQSAEADLVNPDHLVTHNKNVRAIWRCRQRRRALDKLAAKFPVAKFYLDTALKLCSYTPSDRVAELDRVGAIQPPPLPPFCPTLEEDITET